MFGDQIRDWFIGPLDQPFQVPSLALFDLQPENCVRAAADAPIRLLDGFHAAFRFEEPLNTLRPDFNSGVYNAGWSRPFCFDIRDRAHSKIPARQDGRFDRVYVARGDATHRRIVNEGEVIALLAIFGFAMVTPGQMSFAEQVATFRAARCILGTHGAGLTNLLWASEGASIIEFMPEGFFDVGYRFLAPIAGHRHAAIVCRARPSERGLPYADIEVDIDLLRDALRNL